MQVSAFSLLTSPAIPSSGPSDFLYNICYSSDILHRPQWSGCRLARLPLKNGFLASIWWRGSADCLLGFLHTLTFCEFNYLAGRVFGFLIHCPGWPEILGVCFKWEPLFFAIPFYDCSPIKKNFFLNFFIYFGGAWRERERRREIL